MTKEYNTILASFKERMKEREGKTRKETGKGQPTMETFSKSLE